MAALGSDDVAIKGDADEAGITLELGDTTCTRTLRRATGGIEASGDPYLEDPDHADLFAFLLESNEARRAVATGADLRDLIMRPVDTAEIQNEVDQLVDRRESLERELDAIDERKGELLELEQRRTTLQDRIEQKRAELETKKADLDAADADIEQTRDEQSELEDRLDELRQKRSALEDVRYDIETERESLALLEEERRELVDERAALPDSPEGKVDEFDDELQRLRDRKAQLDAELTELQNVIGFNEEMLDSDESGAVQRVVEHDDGNVTDRLVDDGVVCWTCGTEVESEQISATVDRLRELSRSKVAEVNDLERSIEDLQSEKREIEQARRDRERIERRLSEIETEIERAETTIEDLNDRRETLTEDVETLETEIDELEREDYDEVLDLHKEVNRIEYELSRLETDLEDVETEIGEAEERIAEQDDLEEDLEDVTGDIEALRTKIDRVEQGAVERFNEHMESVLDLLEYANLERVWIERVEREGREGRRTVTERVFELHVVRTSDSGVAYEDKVDHLSESEREVTGLVFALAGYLVHEVYEEIPFMLLDSLEAVDAERIAALVEYLTGYTNYLLVALLPEDAAVLSDEYERITEI
jgi:DNA repair exonuclease SbcCD ATPase subunit